jgi:hypothetical protein
MSSSSRNTEALVGSGAEGRVGGIIIVGYVGARRGVLAVCEAGLAKMSQVMLEHGVCDTGLVLTAWNWIARAYGLPGVL